MIKQKSLILSNKCYIEVIKEFMYSISIYKKVFSLLILMGLILCNGICVYAHGNELMKAIDISSKNQGKEIKFICVLKIFIKNFALC